MQRCSLSYVKVTDLLRSTKRNNDLLLYFLHVRGKCGENSNKRKSQVIDFSILSFHLRTQTRGRTGMEVNPLVFETSASTDSAIWAFSFFSALELLCFSIAMQRYGFFLYLQYFTQKKFKKSFLASILDWFLK